MTLLNPLALLWALLIALVLLLHFRRPSKILYLSNLHLWQIAVTESDDKRPILQKIRKNRLLILQILFLSLMVLTLARPSLLLWNKSQTVVFVIDCSASMNAQEKEGTRLDLARRKALKLVNETGGNDRVLIVQGKLQPVLNYYSGSDKGSLRQALENLSATQDSADIGQALIMGISSVGKGEPDGSGDPDGSSDPYEAFVFSDGTQSIPLAGDNDRVHYIQIGESKDNVAITKLSVRNNPFSSYDREIYAEAANFSDRANKFRLEMSLEKTLLLDQPVELSPGQRKSFAVKAPSAGKGMIKASIDIQDDLNADNKATTSLDAKKISVLLATAGNRYLEKALNVNPRVVYTMKKPEDCTAEELTKFDVIIVDGRAPGLLPPANYFILEHPEGAPTVVSKGLVSPLPRHPVMSFVNLRNVVVEEALPLKIGSSETVLIEEGGKPLMAASETGPFRMLRLGFDVRSSNLPLTLSFPILISNIVDWLGSRTDEAASHFDERESDIKPVFKPQNGDANFSEKPVLARTGWEIYRILLLIALAVLILGLIF
jgi:Ca-activated chloride channel homolog